MSKHRLKPGAIPMCRKLTVSCAQSTQLAVLHTRQPSCRALNWHSPPCRSIIHRPCRAQPTHNRPCRALNWHSRPCRTIINRPSCIVRSRGVRWSVYAGSIWHNSKATDFWV